MTDQTFVPEPVSPDPRAQARRIIWVRRGPRSRNPRAARNACPGVSTCTSAARWVPRASRTWRARSAISRRPTPRRRACGHDAHPVDPALGDHRLGEAEHVALVAGDAEGVEALGLLVAGRLAHLREGGEALHRHRLGVGERLRPLVAVGLDADARPRTGGGGGPRPAAGHHGDAAVRLEALAGEHARAGGRRRRPRRPTAGRRRARGARAGPRARPRAAPRGAARARSATAPAGRRPRRRRRYSRYASRSSTRTPSPSRWRRASSRRCSVPVTSMTIHPVVSRTSARRMLVTTSKRFPSV